jgi:hypothetical protein
MRHAFTGITLLLAAASGCADQPAEPASRRIDPPPLKLRADGLSCTDQGARLSSGAPYQICFDPANWNRDIIVLVPGYTDPASAPSAPDALSDARASVLFTTLGYGFASTGFRATGLIEPSTWIDEDLLELVATAKSAIGSATGRSPRFVFQAGGSQGGLATVLAVERHPSVFSGGLAGCGPIGDYRKQIDYVADFRLVFDRFFAPVMEGWPVWRQQLPEDPGFVDPSTWEAARPAIEAAVVDPANASRISQVLAVTGAPTDPTAPTTVLATTEGLLRYSFRAPNDFIGKLGGAPFSNDTRTYTGSLDDAALNAGIERFVFTADPAKVADLQTSGRLLRPLVTIHTTGDPIVPIWHEALYRDKLSWFGRHLETHIRVDRYGHCTLTEAELLAAFAVLVLKTTGHDLLVRNGLLRDQASRAEFRRLARLHGAEPLLTP